MSEQIDVQSHYALFFEPPETTTFATEKAWARVIMDPAERQRFFEWLQVNSAVVRRAYTIAHQENVDPGDHDKVAVLMIARVLEQATRVAVKTMPNSVLSGYPIEVPQSAWGRACCGDGGDDSSNDGGCDSNDGGGGDGASAGRNDGSDALD